MERLNTEEKHDIICAVPWRWLRTLQDMRMDIGWWGRETLIEGDLKVWTIINISQIHYHPNTWVDSYADPIRYRLLAMYQKAIYGELASQKIEHIFVEWFKLEDNTPNLEIWKRQKQKLLKDPEEREELFVKYGWAIVYFLENPKVKIYPTEEKDYQKQLDRPNISCEEQDAIHKKREDFTVRGAKELLMKQPWSRVAIVFWARHLFWDNIEDIFWAHLPRLERVTFPAIAERFLERR